MNKYDKAIKALTLVGAYAEDIKISDEFQLAIQALEKQVAKFVICKDWKGTRNTRYTCPNCNKNVRNDETYCHKCGQRIKFPKIVCENNKCKLDWSNIDE